jgi:preprotein translocase subunit SecB
VNEEVHEVELKIKVGAKADEGDLYLIEVAYCGLVGLRNLPDEHAHAFLYAEAPRILFPFARRVIADATRDLGFQPLMVDPIDFNGLYVQQLQRRAEEQAAAGDALQTPAGQA